MLTTALLLFIAAACGRSPLDGTAQPLSAGGGGGAGGVTDTGGAHPVNFGGVGGGIPTALQGTMVVLAYDQMDPVSIAVDDTHVYWANTWQNDGETSSRIASVSTSGGPITVLARPFRAGGIALAANDLYFSGYDAGSDKTPSLMRIPKRGGKVVKVSNGFVPEHLAIANNTVYGTGDVPDAGYVPAQVPLAGGTMRPLIPVPPTDLGDGMIHAVAVDGDAVYWGTAGRFGYPSTITKVPLKGGPALNWASDATEAYGIALDSTSLYWVKSTRIMKLPLAGDLPITLAPNQGHRGFQGIAVSEKYVYWTDHGNGGNVSKVPIDGGQVTVLASGLQHPSGIVVDNTSVYWTNTNEGTGRGYIMKLTPR